MGKNPESGSEQPQPEQSSQIEFDGGTIQDLSPEDWRKEGWVLMLSDVTDQEGTETNVPISKAHFTLWKSKQRIIEDISEHAADIIKLQSKDDFSFTYTNLQLRIFSTEEALEAGLIEPIEVIEIQ